MEKTLYQLIREKHQPKQGDIYMRMDLPEEMCLIRLERKLKGRQWKARRYSFIDEDFTAAHANIATEGLNTKEYQLLLHPLQKTLTMADQLYCGTAPEKIDPVEIPDKRNANAKGLIIYKEKIDSNIDAWNAVKFILLARLFDMQKAILQKTDLIEKHTQILSLIAFSFELENKR